MKCIQSQALQGDRMQQLQLKLKDMFPRIMIPQLQFSGSGFGIPPSQQIRIIPTFIKKKKINSKFFFPN